MHASETALPELVLASQDLELTKDQPAAVYTQLIAQLIEVPLSGQIRYIRRRAEAKAAYNQPEVVYHQPAAAANGPRYRWAMPCAAKTQNLCECTRAKPASKVCECMVVIEVSAKGSMPDGCFL